MNSNTIQYVIFLAFKFMPIIIGISFSDMMYEGKLKNGNIEIGTIIFTLILIIIQIPLLRFQNVNFDEDNYEIIGWNKHQIFPWDSVKSFKLFNAQSLKIGRIESKESKKVFFFQYGYQGWKNPFMKQKGLNKNLDIVEKIKFKYSI